MQTRTGLLRASGVGLTINKRESASPSLFSCHGVCYILLTRLAFIIMDWSEILQSHSQGPLAPHLSADAASRLSVAERLVRDGRVTAEEAAQILGVTPEVATQILMR